MKNKPTKNLVSDKKARVLLFDIETTPNIVYTWGMYEQNVISVIEDWHLLSFAYKWLGEGNIKAEGAYGKEKQLVKKLWDLFNEADIIIAHNGDEFDIKKANALFAKFKLNPPTPYRTIDTKKIAKKYFRYDSNKLDELGRYLGLGRKVNTGGFELWEGCMAGNKKSWRLMLEYNKQDVILLEKVYLKLRGWINNHPNLNIITGAMHNCPNCGSHKLQKRGFRVTNSAFYQRYQCQSCGAWSSGAKIKQDEIAIK